LLLYKRLLSTLCNVTNVNPHQVNAFPVITRIHKGESLAVSRCVLIGCHESWHSQRRKLVTTDLLHQYDAGGEGYLSQIVKGMKPGSIILNLNPIVG